MNINYDSFTVQKLRTKRVLCNWIIRNLRGAWADDPRAENALEIYRAQRRLINAALRKKQGIDPPTMQVGLRPLSLSARRH